MSKHRKRSVPKRTLSHRFVGCAGVGAFFTGAGGGTGAFTGTLRPGISLGVEEVLAGVLDGGCTAFAGAGLLPEPDTFSGDGFLKIS